MRDFPGKICQRAHVRILFRIVLIGLIAAAFVFFTRQKMMPTITVENEPEGPSFNVIRSFQFKDPDELKQWEEKILSKKNTSYSVVERESRTCVKADSSDGASTRFIKQNLAADKWPFVAWDWCVEIFPKHKKAESIENKKEFDFAAQIYVVFYSRFFLNTRAIQYVWATDLPQGYVADNPYTKNVKVIVLETGASSEWKREERNIRDDYKMLFGEELDKDVVGIAFMTDADSTDSTAVAYFTNFELGYADFEKNKKVSSAEDDEKTERSWLTDLFAPKKK